HLPLRHPLRGRGDRPGPRPRRPDRRDRGAGGRAGPGRGGLMRFGVSRVLDAIEARLSLDPALARGVLDLSEVVRLVDLDGDTAKPATLLRVGRVVDAFAQHLAEDGVAVYVVANRALLSDLDLPSPERMVLRRWADDGLVEVLETAGDR